MKFSRDAFHNPLHSLETPQNDLWTIKEASKFLMKGIFFKISKTVCYIIYESC